MTEATDIPSSDDASQSPPQGAPRTAPFRDNAFGDGRDANSPTRANLKRENRRLKTREHFILLGIRHYAPYYGLIWLGAIIFALIFMRWLEPVVNNDFTRFFAGSTLTISITTITLALPTALNIVLDRYSKYTNRNIINILVQRFPISLLTLSAFTSLVISLLVASGILGIYFSPAGASTVAFSLLIMIWWAAVCIIYLFIVIEKMVYFVVNAPEAVLEKLEFGVYATVDLSNKERYADFRSQLASINDIAATLVEQSTGRDVVILRCLDALRTIHRLYLVKGIPETQIAKRKLDFKAVHAVNQEVVRIYRESATAKNENATLSILNTWCLMVHDAVVAGADNLYIAEMMSQIQRFQSYAETSFVEVIEEQVYTDWYFLLAAQLQDDSGLPYTRIAMVRELSAALRRITINGEDNLFLRFMRVASNSDLDINLEGLNRIWLGLLDRAVFIYLTWLLTVEPRDVETYLGYLATYSSQDSNWMRSVLVDTPNRLYELFRLTELSESVEAAQPGTEQQVRTDAEQLEESVRRSATGRSGDQAVSIIDDAEDLSVGHDQTVSVVTQLVADQGLPRADVLDDATRKEVQTQTSKLTEDDPRVLGGTAALMGLPDTGEGSATDDGSVLAFLVLIARAGVTHDDLAAHTSRAERLFTAIEALHARIPNDNALARKVALAQRCSPRDLFAILAAPAKDQTPEPAVSGAKDAKGATA